MDGSANLRDNQKLRDLMVKRHQEGKWDAAMCAAPRALAKYGVLDNADYTCYPGIEEEAGKYAPTAHFSEKLRLLITSTKFLPAVDQRQPGHLVMPLLKL